MASASGERMIFYKDQWSTYVVALAASAHQGRCIVPLLQPFVKRFSIKICTAIDKEKAGVLMYIMSVPMHLHTHDVHDRNYTQIPLSTPSLANI